MKIYITGASSYHSFLKGEGRYVYIGSTSVDKPNSTTITKNYLTLPAIWP